MSTRLTSSLIGLAVAACGGPQVPNHSGYRNDKLKPWLKAKALKFNDKNEAKAEDDLNYGAFKRARWFLIDLPSHGELTIKLEVTPPGDATNEDFDLALEVLDPHFRVISKSDLEEPDAGELAKTKTLFDLEAGKYFVHVYLQSRLDTADFVLRAAFKPTKAAELKSDFPSQVAFYPSLPMVPLSDDTPAKYRPPKPVVVRTTTRPKPNTPPPPQTSVSARIVSMSVVSATSTRIMIGRGTESGADNSMRAKLNGIASTFSIECNPGTCSAVIPATPDQIKAGGLSVVLVK